MKTNRVSVLQPAVSQKLPTVPRLRRPNKRVFVSCSLLRKRCSVEERLNDPGPFCRPPSKGQVGLAANRIGPVERREEQQASLYGLPAGGPHHWPRGVQREAGKCCDALPLQSRGRYLSLPVAKEIMGL